MQSNRRRFLVAGGLTALAASRAYGANDAIHVGAIGCGGRMRTLLACADQAEGFDLVAASDVYEPRRDEIRERTNELASTHLDYRELLEKKEIDAVIVAAPDHWHVRIALDALAAGKDVYLEKPVTHTLEEGDLLIRAVRGSKQVVQCGMQQRSWSHFQNAVELIHGGTIGAITQIRTYWYQNYQSRRPPNPIDTQFLDWKRWLGGAPEQPFDEEKFRHWRWYWNFGGGALTDLFTHWIDVVHWAMKNSEPQRVETMGDRYVFEKWDCPETVQSILRYPGFQVGFAGTMVSAIDDGGLEFRGTTGTLKLDRRVFSIYRDRVNGESPVLTERSFADGTIAHMHNFFDRVRDRKPTNAPVEAGVAAAHAGHLANAPLRPSIQSSMPKKF
jgi:predicted dehydrogenase